MAKRTEKRMSKKELRTPDKVEATLTRAMDWVGKNSKLLWVLLVVFIAGGVAYVMNNQAAKAEVDATATDLRRVFDPMVSSVGADEDDTADLTKRLGVPAFTDRKSQLEAVTKGAEAFLSANGDNKAAPAIKFVQASSHSALGDSTKGAEALAKWLSENNGTSLEFTALIQLGDAQAASGKFEEAKTTFEKLAASTSEKSLGRALALTRLGDLQNPLNRKGGDGAEALKQYEAARTIIGVDTANPLTRELDLKLAFLK